MAVAGIRAPSASRPASQPIDQPTSQPPSDAACRPRLRPLDRPGIPVPLTTTGTFTSSRCAGSSVDRTDCWTVAFLLIDRSLFLSPETRRRRRRRRPSPKMHSPPPTPSSRSNGHAYRVADVLSDNFEDGHGFHAVSKKRTREQAGLITPRETPRKVELNSAARENGGRGTAKVLFPSVKRRKFEVFQDPRSPDPFSDDPKNPFAQSTLVRPGPTDAVRTPRRSRLGRETTPDDDTTSKLDLPDVGRTTRKTRRGTVRTPSPLRSDGMTYVFRGKRVFRKYHSTEEAETADAIRPRRLFVKEMTAPKLSNPFEESTSDQEGFDGLELSTDQQQGSSSRSTTSTTQPRTPARRLF